jgi:hypothetical protein
MEVDKLECASRKEVYADIEVSVFTRPQGE